ncbi:GATA zinc finger domain-containing protein 7 [Drosophila hydei]|uniref:GATA zinc finger domain-containing protein 7 n=1 Tax=Drosophila hydei TaxID=7224 RepID=A0A6J2STZ9_DROHY|nr:GATA zinc finger domain-containing protein 7 [Drosophila hydei]XP_030080596.1 GATA zinc finger domain-containing protein 7 [Drosophila hydei]
MSSSGASAAQYKLDANSNAIALIAADAAALPPSPSPSASAQASPADRIEWSRATILGFIEDYRRQRVLWDPNTKGYHIKQTKYEALKLLSQKYGTEIRSIRSKIKSLRSSFHREHGKVINGRSRGVHYQPMWFAYEAIRFILDGERDADTSGMDAVVDGDVEPAAAAALLDSEAADKLTLMHSLDLEQLTAAAGKQQVEQHEDFAARVAAAVAAVAAAAAAANVREREHNMDDDAAASDGNSNGCAGNGSGSDATASSAAAAAAISAAVTRSSSDLDGESYCNISAEDVKTEIIEHEPELGMLERQTSTPLSLSASYCKPTDLTYNPRKRKAQMDELDGCDVSAGVGVGIVGGVVGALTLTPIKSTGQTTALQQQHQHQQQQQQQHPHNQIAFHTLQQHFSHNLSHSSHNGNGHTQPQQLQHQQQQQQQHSNNMAQKRDRGRDLSCSPTLANNNNNNNNNNSNNNNSNNNNSSLDLATTASSGVSSLTATPLKMNNNSSSMAGSSHVDEYGVFGEYVAITIRKLKTSKSKIVVKHLINNLLYEAELGKYDQGMPASKEPPQLYKMQ